MASRSELQRALWDRRAERAARFDHPPPPMTLQTLLKQPRPVLPAPVLRSSAGSLRGGSAGSLRGARPTRAAEAAAIVRATTPSLDWSSQRARRRAPRRCRLRCRRNRAATTSRSRCPRRPPCRWAAVSAARSSACAPIPHRRCSDVTRPSGSSRRPTTNATASRRRASCRLSSSRTGYARRRRRARRRARHRARGRPSGGHRLHPRSSWAPRAGGPSPPAALAPPPPPPPPPRPPPRRPRRLRRTSEQLPAPRISAPAGPGAALRRAAVRSRCGSPSTPRPAWRERRSSAQSS